MPRIPLASFTPTATPEGSARANLGMFDPLARAAESIGQSARDIGQGMVQFQLKKDAAVNYATLADADRTLKSSFVSFQDELESNGDETTFVPEWQKRMTEVEKNLGMEKMAPVVRERLSVQLKDWQVQTTAAVRSQATAREISRSKALVTDAADYDLKLGDVDGYSEKIRGGEARGLFSAKEAQDLVKSGSMKAQYYQATNLILKAPMEAIDALKDETDGGKWRNYPDLDESQRKTLVDSANVAVQRVRAETYQDLIMRMNGGELIGDKELEGFVVQKLMTPTQARDIKRNQSKQAGLAGVAGGVFSGLLTDINAYDPRGDGTNEVYANLAIRVAGLPPGLKEDAYSRLKDKKDPASPMNTQVARDAMSQVDSSFRAGLFGQYETQELDTKTGVMTKKTDAKAYQAALDKKVKVEDALTEYFRANPKATRVDAMAYVGKLQEADIAKQGMGFFVAPDTQRLLQTPGPAEVDAILKKYKSTK